MVIVMVFLNKINALDLTYIAHDMCSEKYPLPRWEMTQALKCMQLYKNFLYLFKLYPQEPLVPTREIDEFWHNHILYTKNYHRDCLQIFGYYLHHSPLTPNDNREKLVNHYLKTKQYYLDIFQEPMALMIAP